MQSLDVPQARWPVVARFARGADAGNTGRGNGQLNLQHPKLQHHFRPRCSISTFSEGTGPAGQNMAAVNVRCLDGIDLTGLKTSTFDGRSK